jgi:DNA helicase-2/ATP-dependent DNA helicase PcrA
MTLQGTFDSPPVQLMTLHSAKGLEFDFVTIIGLEDGNLPSLRGDKDKNIEEERRLAYVGITRAKNKLLLCCSQSRSEFGRVSSYSISRFVKEIPQELLIQNEQNTSSQLLKMEISRWLSGKGETDTTAQTAKFAKFSASAFKKTPIPQVATKKPTEQKPISSFFKLNQAISHKVFGVGIIKKIINDGESIVLEISFLNYGVKKINSQFVRS